MTFFYNYPAVNVNSKSIHYYQHNHVEEKEDCSNSPTKPRHLVNARERCRTQSYFSVNTAFQILRALIPTEPYNRKLSKIEILRLATSYITHLEAIITTGIMEQPCALYLTQQNPNNVIDNDDGRSKICTFCANSFK